MKAEAAMAEIALSFQVNGDDLGPIFVDRLRAEWNGHCPLAEELSRYRPASRAGSPGVQEVVSHPRFAAVAAIVTGPDFRMLHRTGGGALPLSIFGTYRSRSVGGDALVAVSPSFNGSYLLQYFPDAAAYLDWWVDTIASKTVESTANHLPPPTSLESLAYVLHAVDAYRRATLQSLLSYAPTDEPSITAREFVETMPRSMGSMDLRWLLPTFLFLTPGLNSIPFKPRPEHMEVLAENDFLIPAGDEKTGENLFRFGEAGKAMGVEFYRSWMMAVGFDTAVLSAQGERVLHRAFLAPTALANHLFSLEVDAAGNGRVNHQAMTAAALRRKLEETLKADLEVEPGAPVPVSRPAAPTPAAAKPAGNEQGVAAARCPSCGSEVNPKARFCRACGKPIPEPAAPKAARFCPNCGAKAEPGVRFCGECGTAL